jgi:hypothetical protein
MRTPRSVFVRLGGLVALVVAAGCGDSPISPDELDAAQASEIQAMLGEVLAKLGDIEERIDSLEATIDEAGSMPVTLTGLPAEQLDSIMAVASWIAQDIVEESMGGWEFCGEFAGGFEVGLKFASQAEGKASADLGAWAGTGAFAGGTVKGAGTLEGGLAGEGKAAIAYCNPFGEKVLPGDARPATAPLNGPSRAGELAALETALTNVATQLNLTPAALSQALTGVGGAFSGSATFDLQGVGDYLPLPPALAAIADDPIGTAVSRVQGLTTTATSALCSGGNWGTNVSVIINQACDVIDAGGLASITVLADIASTYPAVQMAVGNACTRVNSIGLQRLIVPSWDVTFPLGIGTVEVFPGYNQRLFPNYASFACP